MDDERLKNPKQYGEDYFDELLERIREIRASEKRFYQKICDIYKTSIDYSMHGYVLRRCIIQLSKGRLIHPNIIILKKHVNSSVAL